MEIGQENLYVDSGGFKGQGSTFPPGHGFSVKNKQLLDEVFVIPRTIKVEVSVMSQAEGRG